MVAKRHEIGREVDKILEGIERHALGIAKAMEQLRKLLREQAFVVVEVEEAPRDRR